MPTTIDGSCTRIEDDETIVPARKTDGEASEEARIREAMERMRVQSESGVGRRRNIVVDPDGNARIEWFPALPKQKARGKRAFFWTDVRFRKVRSVINFWLPNF